MYEGTFHAIVAVLRQIVQLVQMGGYDLIHLNYRDSKPIYEQIKDGFRKLIITNSLSANEKLPSVRELASGLAINPNTIQKAIWRARDIHTRLPGRERLWRSTGKS